MVKVVVKERKAMWLTRGATRVNHNFMLIDTTKPHDCGSTLDACTFKSAGFTDAILL